MIDKCKKHPKYKAIRKPQCDCSCCWEMYLKEKTRLLQQELDFDAIAFAKVEQILKESLKIVQRKLKERSK